MTATHNGGKAAALKAVNLREVCALTSFSRSTVYNLVRQGQFPRPFQMGQRRVAWREAEVLAWLERRQSVTWAAA